MRGRQMESCIETLILNPQTPKVYWLDHYTFRVRGWSQRWLEVKREQYRKNPQTITQCIIVYQERHTERAERRRKAFTHPLSRQPQPLALLFPSVKVITWKVLSTAPKPHLFKSVKEAFKSKCQYNRKMQDLGEKSWKKKKKKHLPNTFSHSDNWLNSRINMLYTLL